MAAVRGRRLLDPTGCSIRGTCCLRDGARPFRLRHLEIEQPISDWGVYDVGRRRPAALLLTPESFQS